MAGFFACREGSDELSLVLVIGVKLFGTGSSLGGHAL